MSVCSRVLSVGCAATLALLGSVGISESQERSAAAAQVLNEAESPPASSSRPNSGQSGAESALATLEPEAPLSRETTPAKIDVEPPNPILTALVAKLAASEKSPDRQTDPNDWSAIKAFYTVGETRLVWTNEKGFTDRAKRVLDEIRKADDWGLVASDFDLPKLTSTTPEPTVLADAELKTGLAVLKYARHARGGRLNPRSVSRLFDQKPDLLEPISVLLLISKSDTAGAFLRELHPQHPQFNRLRLALAEARKGLLEQSDEDIAKLGGSDTKQTAKAKTKSKTARNTRASIRRIIANMERWRWMPRDLGPFYVWDDVPEQTTSVFKNGTELLKEKIVVGKPSTPTPMFSADMKYVIFKPSWGVPPGMKANELLPKLRNTGGGGWFSTKPLASSVLRAHKLNVTRGGRPVNPDSVDWSNVNISNYHFSQPPGPKNVLGVVKFRFPNKHNVYMHDTPERHLFGGKRRTFSHGCMRVQNPVRLAEVLLQHDRGWDSDRVKQAKRRGERVELETPIPVHISYFTAHVDDTGKVDVRPDIYGVDSRVASALEGRRVRVGSVASGTKVKKRRSYVRKKKRKPRRRAEKKEPFNPFASMQ